MIFMICLEIAYSRPFGGSFWDSTPQMGSIINGMPNGTFLRRMTPFDELAPKSV